MTVTATESKTGVSFLEKYATPIAIPWWETTGAINFILVPW